MITLIENKFFYILPKDIRRTKRGLINGLGTIIKTISGNLDDNDAQRIETEIDKIRKNNYALADNQKNSISLMKQVIDEYSENLDKIQRNLEMLSTNLENIDKNLTSLSSRIDIVHIHIQIENEFQQIYDKVTVLETAITFASLGILHPSIIDPLYLLSELIKISKDFKLPLEAKRENIHLLERSISVKAYSTLNILTFILEIPIVSPILYDLLHLYSIPNNQNLTRIPKSSTLILSNDKFSYTHEPCQPLADGLQICSHLKLEDTHLNPDCIIRIIQHSHAENCVFAELSLSSLKIEQIHENTWLAIIPKEDILKTTCGNDNNYQRVRGTYILTTTETCTFTLGGQVLQTHHSTLTLKETIPLPKIGIPTANVTFRHLNLENVKLDNLKSIVTQIDNNMKTIDETAISSKPSWTSIAIIIALIVVAIYYAYTRLVKYKRTGQRPTPTDPMTQRSSESSAATLQHQASPDATVSCPPDSRSSLRGEELRRLSP